MPKHPADKTVLIRSLKFEPLTRKNWDTFVELFGEKGACANCWCMYYRLSRTEFEKGRRANLNKGRMKRLVWSGKPIGLIAMYSRKPVGWIALAPREDYLKFKSSRIHKPVDNLPVWSISCFFINKDFRRKRLSFALLKAAVAYARKNGVEMLEAYPIVLGQKKWPDSFLWVGPYSSFERAGFKVVGGKSKSRPIVRFDLMNKSRPSRSRRTGVTF